MARAVRYIGIAAHSLHSPHLAYIAQLPGSLYLHFSIRCLPASSPPSTSYYQSSPSPRVPTSLLKPTNAVAFVNSMACPFILDPVVDIVDFARGISRLDG
ncbi:hypothetical protein N7489_002530 [Penicillium chrysogenum]|uniref:uncharacterized protein n=1 Tax=Penicillium chrysogenum TaxID=5076 RepID=UPI0024DF1D44|nr:uncharacterized protein N7489_002530 [Penicillium chrysogenum]KAJ5252120.1 hypothetical protein N7489_002530 [Penicillium chrysogenum]